MDRQKEVMCKKYKREQTTPQEHMKAEKTHIQRSGAKKQKESENIMAHIESIDIVL